MTSKKFTVKLPKASDAKTEARPIAEIVQTASRFQSDVFLISGSKKINAKSIMGMMSLKLTDDVEIEVETNGEDEEQAAEAIVKYMSSVA